MNLTTPSDLISFLELLWSSQYLLSHSFSIWLVTTPLFFRSCLLWLLVDALMDSPLNNITGGTTTFITYLCALLLLLLVSYSTFTSVLFKRWMPEKPAKNNLFKMLLPLSDVLAQKIAPFLRKDQDLSLELLWEEKEEAPQRDLLARELDRSDQFRSLVNKLEPAKSSARELLKNLVLVDKEVQA